MNHFVGEDFKLKIQQFLYRDKFTVVGVILVENEVGDAMLHRVHD